MNSVQRPDVIRVYHRPEQPNDYWPVRLKNLRLLSLRTHCTGAATCHTLRAIHSDHHKDSYPVTCCNDTTYPNIFEALRAYTTGNQPAFFAPPAPQVMEEGSAAAVFAPPAPQVMEEGSAAAEGAPDAAIRATRYARTNQDIIEASEYIASVARQKCWCLWNRVSVNYQAPQSQQINLDYCCDLTHQAANAKSLIDQILARLPAAV